MSETTYSIENAKSARSSCKKCKVKIEKGEIRLGVSAPGPGDFMMSSWYHPKCYTLPRKLVSNGTTPETFVSDLLEDHTDDRILSTSDGVKSITAEIAEKPAKKGAAPSPAKDSSASLSASKYIKRIKSIWADISKEEEQNEEGSEPPKKKMKKLDLWNEAKVYGEYAELTNDNLKDELRWNKQMVGGNKDVLLVRIIDGNLRGRLGRCAMCGKGRLKLLEEDCTTTAHCNGYFDEDNQIRVSCFFQCPIKDAARLHPWYSEEPTEEQKEEMKAAEESAEGISESSAGNSEDAAKARLAKAVSTLAWDLGNSSGIKKAAAAMLKVCTSSEDKIDLPEDEARARIEIGRLIVSDTKQSAAEVLALIVSKFGFAKKKSENAEKKLAAIAAVCGHPSNAAVMEAMLELGDLYFREGNRNAGSTYKKVAAAIKNLKFEITSGNAKGLSKGKTKVAGIGKSSSDKIYEFVTTGTIEKLEEKRAST